MERLRCVDNNSSKPCKAYLGKSGSVDNFINNTIEESKYWTDVMKKHFNKELVMTKEDNKDFNNFAKCRICDDDDDDYDDEDDELFLWYGWPMSKILNCTEPEPKLSWIKLCSSDNHYTTAPTIMLIAMLKYEIIVILLENIEALNIKIVISILN